MHAVLIPEDILHSYLATFLSAQLQCKASTLTTSGKGGGGGREGVTEHKGEKEQKRIRGRQGGRGRSQ